MSNIPFGRIGSKRKLFKEIVNYIPPHETYIEPFFGGGSVFFLKEKSKFSVINDIDTELIRDFENILKIGKNDSTEDLKICKTHDEVDYWIKNTPSTPLNDFIKSYYHCRYIRAFVL